MLYQLLLFAHLVGLMLIAAGLIGVFLADLRSRQARTLPVFAEAVRSLALNYDGLVVPGAIVLAGSGTWLVAAFHGWGFLEQPWLAGMVALFLFELVEGNTVTRVYFTTLRRLTAVALAEGGFTDDLRRLRGRAVPTFTHFLDLPILLSIVALGAIRPDSWGALAAAAAAALATATALTILLPRLYPGEPIPAAVRS